MYGVVAFGVIVVITLVVVVLVVGGCVALSLVAQPLTDLVVAVGVDIANGRVVLTSVCPKGVVLVFEDVGGRAVVVRLGRRDLPPGCRVRLPRL